MFIFEIGSSLIPPISRSHQNSRSILDMLHVINGGDKPTQKFQDFVDLCCKGFNLVRKNGNLLLNLFALMASSGIPGLDYYQLNRFMFLLLRRI